MALVCHSFHYSLSLGCANLCVCFIHCSVVVLQQHEESRWQQHLPSTPSERTKLIFKFQQPATKLIQPHHSWTSSFWVYSHGFWYWPMVLQVHLSQPYTASTACNECLRAGPHAYLLIKRSLSSKYFLVKYVFQLQYCLRAKARIPDSFSFFSCRSEQNE